MLDKSKNYENERIIVNEQSNAFDGSVSLSKSKLVWFFSMFITATIGGYSTFSIDAFLLFLGFTAITLCFGHSLGMHRKLIHQSYKCPKWLEYVFVHLGVIVGIAGPRGMMQTHDLRDWAQRQPCCHDYFAHRQSILKDAYWQILCDIRLGHPPIFLPESNFISDKTYQNMEKYWMWQQIPWVVLFFTMGGIAWVIWGVCMRVTVSIIGHWLIGYFAHNKGDQDWHVQGACVQGYNVKFMGLITMGECWHNNHHAFPNSACLGQKPHQADPGWWVLRILNKLGLVSEIILPEDLPKRSELTSL
ncbi:MAG: acyl-CoA desaturase [Kangiellaceae bacterium]